jgi:pimeloyl-ACP methyl ester carboxylesterase
VFYQLFLQPPDRLRAVIALSVPFRPRAFRAVAPDLRGYGRSDRPEEVWRLGAADDAHAAERECGVEKYTILHDIGDIVGLVDALGRVPAAAAGANSRGCPAGAKQAVIAGHDVGGTIACRRR